MLRIYGLPEEGRADAAKRLADRGFDAVVVSVDETADTISPALDAGLRVWSCRAAFSVSHLAEPDSSALLARDVDGEPRLWFGSGCPNQPALREAHLRHIRSVAESGAYNGFMLDGIRFASPNAAHAFFTCFCDTCFSRATDLGVHLESARRDVRSLRDWCRSSGTPLADDPTSLASAMVDRWPGITVWLRFRTACIAEHVAEVRSAVDELNVRGIEFQLGAYLFAPSLAPLVGQDYAALAPLLDVVSPMLYRTLGPGDACLTSEHAALAALNLVPSRPQFISSDIVREVRLARRALAGTSSLVPILQLADDQLAGVIDATNHTSVDGLDFYIYRSDTERYLETTSRGTRARI